MQNIPATCAKCHLTVAAYDPERVQINLSVYHGKCWKLVRNENQYKENCRLSLRSYHFMSDGIG